MSYLPNPHALIAWTTDSACKVSALPVIAWTEQYVDGQLALAAVVLWHGEATTLPDWARLIAYLPPDAEPSRHQVVNRAGCPDDPLMLERAAGQITRAHTRGGYPIKGWARSIEEERSS
jgi:hypothetical protein